MKSEDNWKDNPQYWVQYWVECYNDEINMEEFA